MKNRLAFWFITGLILVLVLYSLAFNVVIPVMTKNQIPKTFVNAPKTKEKEDKKKKAAKNESDEAVPDSILAKSKRNQRLKFSELRRDEKFLQSKLNLVNGDSMYLVLDLSQKTAVLELKGVSLHESHILDYKISNSIKDQPEESLLNWVGEPFTLKREDSSIPKSSFLVKIAPKDTIEANQTEVLPAPPKRGDVYVVMDFDRNLRLILEQEEKPDKEGKKNISALKWQYREKEIIKSLNALIHFQREPAMPTIEIILSKVDATLLYRALPYKPKLLLRL